MEESVLFWVIFIIFIVALLVLNLKIFHRKAHIIRLREALLWSAFWIILALVFNVVIYFWLGFQKGLEFFTAYLVEKSLSVDNLFVFLLIFSYFQVPQKYEHKVLFWGILGALVMRILFILAGITLINKLHWMIYIFGGFLVLVGVRMALPRKEEIHPEKNPVLKLFKLFMPITTDFGEGKFFLKTPGRYFATPLFIALLVVETTDVVFAVDSVPAVLAITRDPFIAYTSNVFAILGLRSLFFALSGVMRMFIYLKYGLAIILVFIGAKMLISEHYKIPTHLALAVVGGVLAISILISVIESRVKKKSAS